MRESPPPDKRFGAQQERRYVIRRERRYNGVAPKGDDRPARWSGRQLAQRHARRGNRRVEALPRAGDRERTTRGRLGCNRARGGKRSIAR